MADEITYEQMQDCVENGNCDEAKAAASTYLGIDPELSQAVIDCAETRDSEACAKASAQIAAIAACDFATGGAGAYLCNKYAPQIVSAIWPVLGPPLTAMFDVGFGLFGATFDFMKGVGKLFGIGSSPGTDWDDVVWQLKAAGRKVVASSSISAVEAIGSANVSTRLELGLPIEIAGGLSGPSLSKSTMLDISAVKNVVAKRGDASRYTLVRALRSKPAFASEVRVAWPKRLWGTGSLDQWLEATKPRLVASTYWPTKNELMLRLWGVDLSKWDPAIVKSMASNGTILKDGNVDFADFKVVDSSGEWPSSGKDVRDLQAAFGLAVSERVKALQSACSESVGSTIGSAIAERQQLDQAGKESGSGLLWLLGLAGAGTLLYIYRKRIF